MRAVWPQDALWLTVPARSIQKWGLDIEPDHIYSGLYPWPPNTGSDLAKPALSGLGREADGKYNLGHTTLSDFRRQTLEFVDVGFPRELAAQMQLVVEGYLADPSTGGWTRTESWDHVKNVWQTAKNHDNDDSNEVKTWKGDNMRGWEYHMVTDE